MCRYIVVKADTVNDKHEVIAAEHDYGKACDKAEEYVQQYSDTVEIFERISTALPTTAVKWEGKRRPAISNGTPA
jgi:hypothetical protein